MADSQPQNDVGERGALLTIPGQLVSDAKLLEKSITQRWGPNGGLSDEDKAFTIRRVRRAFKVANKDPRAVAALARVMVAIEGQAQADQHLAVKNARLDEGKPTEGVAHQQVGRVIIHAEPVRRRIDSKLVEGTPGAQETQAREMLEGPPPAEPMKLPPPAPVVRDEHGSGDV